MVTQGHRQVCKSGGGGGGGGGGMLLSEYNYANILPSNYNVQQYYQIG